MTSLTILLFHAYALIYNVKGLRSLLSFVEFKRIMDRLGFFGVKKAAGLIFSQSPPGCVR